MRLDLNHPSLTLSKIVSELAHDFLKNHNFNYFVFIRYYRDGSLDLLVNNPNIFLKYVESGYPLVTSIIKDIPIPYSYIMYWEDYLNKLSSIQFIKEKLNLHQGLSLIRRHKTHYDLMALAMPEVKENVVSYYLTNLHNFEIFRERFIEQAKELLAIVEKQKIILPSFQPEIKPSERASDGIHQRYEILGMHGVTYLTQQEFLCLHLLHKGQTYKEIALRLCISPRTVETYLKRIREKTGCLTRHDLFYLLSRIFL